MLIWQRTTCKCCKKQSVTFKIVHTFFCIPYLDHQALMGSGLNVKLTMKWEVSIEFRFLHDWSIISSVIRIYSSLKSSEKPSLRPWNLKLHEASSFFMSFWLHNYNRIDILLLVIILISWRNTVMAKMFPQINQKIPTFRLEGFLAMPKSLNLGFTTCTSCNFDNWYISLSYFFMAKPSNL